MDGAHMIFRHSSNTRQYVLYLQDVTGQPQGAVAHGHRAVPRTVR